MRQPVGSVVQMIRVEQYFLYAQPTDMRSGVDRLLSLVISAHGRAMPHTAYLFANQSKSRLKVLIHDEFGVWLATRRLHQGRFVWAQPQITSHGTSHLEVTMTLSRSQFDALIVGLPWQRITQLQTGINIL
jgi:transposase